MSDANHIDAYDDAWYNAYLAAGETYNASFRFDAPDDEECFTLWQFFPEYSTFADVTGSFFGTLFNPPFSYPPVKACKSYGLPEINYTFHDLEPSGAYLASFDITDLDVGLYAETDLTYDRESQSDIVEEVRAEFNGNETATLNHSNLSANCTADATGTLHHDQSAILVLSVQRHGARAASRGPGSDPFCDLS